MNTAEGHESTTDFAVAWKLQWGRRVNTAEGATNAVIAARQALLQWGRRVNTAEGARMDRLFAALEK